MFRTTPCAAWNCNPPSRLSEGVRLQLESPLFPPFGGLIHIRRGKMELVRDIGRATATGLAFVAGCLGTAALIILIFQSHELLEKVTSDAGVALVELLKMAIPLLGGVLLARAT